MTDNKQQKIEELYNHLKDNFKIKNFGLRDGYIYSGFTKKIQFELFIHNDRISLKYPYPNISSKKIEILNYVIIELDNRFVYRTYNTVPKNKYSIWDLNINTLSYNEVGLLLISIEDYIK